ncbi:hypothetical protein [Streptomyces sp. NPDC003247]|uniref:hypothetical protein n=1 Tax=Streptomyces sp. NPDC003247 TaxID=3364677 RepID=UPI00367BEFCD
MDETTVVDEGRHLLAAAYPDADLVVPDAADVGEPAGGTPVEVRCSRAAMTAMML